MYIDFIYCEEQSNGVVPFFRRTDISTVSKHRPVRINGGSDISTKMFRTSNKLRGMHLRWVCMGRICVGLWDRGFIEFHMKDETFALLYRLNTIWKNR